MGQSYETGRGTAADPARAAELYSRAAAAGVAPAKKALGDLYAAGRGVEQDLVAAAALL